MSDEKIDILLSTYNGQIFLESQLDSIISQKEENWRLLIRDDGSEDESINIIEAFACRDSRIRIIESEEENLGVVESYFQLLGHSDSPFFAFCDQDDYWLPDKLQKCYQAMIKRDQCLPQLLHSDLTIVDSDLETKFASFMSQQRFTSRSSAVWRNNLLQNSVVGCATMGNKALREIILSNKPTALSDVIMHDWWACMVASCLGEVSYLPEATVLYRQHSDNSLGAKPTGVARYAKSIINERPFSKVRDYLGDVSRQSAAFQEAFADMLEYDKTKSLSRVMDLGRKRSIRRALSLIGCYANGIRMQSRERDFLVLFAAFFV